MSKPALNRASLLTAIVAASGLSAPERCDNIIPPRRREIQFDRIVFLSFSAFETESALTVTTI
jgi:hypothetical protein